MSLTFLFDPAPAWNDLLSRLAGAPRENGSAALAQAASDIAEFLRRAGLTIDRVPFTAHPYEIRFLGVFVSAACLLFLYLANKGRIVAALAVSLLIPFVAVLSVEAGIPVFGGWGATRQENIVARIPARSPLQRIIFSAHYDTKTDVFDHVIRTPIQVSGLPMCVLMILSTSAALASRRKSLQGKFTQLVNFVGIAAAVYGVIFFLAYSGGAVVRSRSSGALDDGAACAVLVRTAAELAQSPPLEHTTVEFIFFSGEELGAEGSARYVQSRFLGRDSLPTYVVNLDPVGASRNLAIAGTEGRLLRSYHPDGRLVSNLDAAFHEINGSSLHLTSRGGLTDAFAFASHGVPTLTLISEVSPFILPRGMHTANDKRSRIEMASLDLVEELLLRFVRRADHIGI